MAAKSFFFIPDISGFTNFVKNVEIDHARHIISELLELIIDADTLDLAVAEVEGDAVFFFKQDEVPDNDKILEQIQNTYVKFHEHLKAYETRRICQCGACTSAADLKLKFVAHKGDANLISVKGNSKPFGEDVIRVHRLLKNSVQENEYILYTDGIADPKAIAENQSGWKKVVEGEDTYDELGVIPYKTIPLSFLRSLVKDPPPIPVEDLAPNPVKGSINISASATDVFELVTNMKYRELWNKGVAGFKYDEGELNQVGAKHVCVFANSREVEFTTVKKDFGKDRLVHGEKTQQIPFTKEATTYYIIEGDDNETNLRVEFHAKTSPLTGWLFKLVLTPKLKKNLVKGLEDLKGLAEQEQSVLAPT